jgi:predicted small metal-binding protein
MKTFACGAVVPSCTATSSGETDDQVLAQVARHACTAHGMETVPEEFVVEVRRHIVLAA